MKRPLPVLRCCLVLSLSRVLCAAEPTRDDSPADHLPPHVRQVTWFGERADWSHDGKRILFLSKTFGDAMELDLSTMRIRNRTAHYPPEGYKASNPVVSDDGRFIAFQLAKSRETAGVGHGILVLDLSKAPAPAR